jgi:hypothetical protein
MRRRTLAQPDRPAQRREGTYASRLPRVLLSWHVDLTEPNLSRKLGVEADEASDDGEPATGVPASATFVVEEGSPAAELYAQGTDAHKLPCVTIPRGDLKHRVGAARPLVVRNPGLPPEWAMFASADPVALRSMYASHPPPPSTPPTPHPPARSPTSSPTARPHAPPSLPPCVPSLPPHPPSLRPAVRASVRPLVPLCIFASLCPAPPCLLVVESVCEGVDGRFCYRDGR